MLPGFMRHACVLSLLVCRSLTLMLYAFIQLLACILLHARSQTHAAISEGPCAADAEDDSTEDEAGLPARLPGAALPEGPLLVAHETEALAPRAALRRLVSLALGCARRLAASRAARADALLRRALLAAFAADGAVLAPAFEAEGAEQVCSWRQDDRGLTLALWHPSSVPCLCTGTPTGDVPLSHHDPRSVCFHDAGASGLHWSVQLL